MQLYGAANQKLLLGTLVLTTTTVYALPVTGGYSPDFTAVTPQLSAIPSAARSVLAATSAQLLSSKVIAQAAQFASFDAADVTFTAVPAGEPIVAIVLMDGTGETANLIAYIDNLSNVPLTPDGRDVKVTWASPMLQIGGP